MRHDARAERRAPAPLSRREPCKRQEPLRGVRVAEQHHGAPRARVTNTQAEAAAVAPGRTWQPWRTAYGVDDLTARGEIAAAAMPLAFRGRAYVRRGDRERTGGYRSAAANWRHRVAT
jgi:hypothetical protein